MKINKIYGLLLGALMVGAASLMTACGDDNVIVQYLKLDTYAHSFEADDDSRLTVAVTSSSNWEYELAEDSWVKVESKTEGQVVFYAEPNTGNSNRYATVLFTNDEKVTAELKITQLGLQPDRGARFFKIENGLTIVMSNRGNYVAYMEEVIEDADQNIIGYYVVLENLETDEVTRTRLGNLLTSVLAVSDNGIVILEIHEASYGAYFKDGVVHRIDVPAGYVRTALSSISADGSTIIGAYVKTGPICYPVKWVNGEAIMLDRPTHNVDGTSMQQIYPRACSEDGLIVVGTVWDIPMFLAVYWDEYNEFHYIAEELLTLTEGEPWYSEWTGEWYTDIAISGAASSVTTTWISPNGRYVALRYQTMAFTGPGEYTLDFHPLFYDLQEKKVIGEVPDIGPDGGRGTTITNEGLGFYLTPDKPRVPANRGFAYDTNTGARTVSSQWIFETFGIDVPDSIIEHYGKDGKSLLGYTATEMNISQFWYIDNY